MNYCPYIINHTLSQIVFGGRREIQGGGGNPGLLSIVSGLESRLVLACIQQYCQMAGLVLACVQQQYCRTASLVFSSIVRWLASVQWFCSTAGRRWLMFMVPMNGWPILLAFVQRYH